MSSPASSYRCCQTASAQLKIYQAFIFSVPIFFAFVLLILFYLFYLRRGRVDWSSLRMRTTLHLNHDISMCEMGSKKEVREMLPIIVFKESFSVKDTNCSVCLGEYEAQDKLQQIPGCGHTYHMECIDHWLASHTTCPLCRLSLVPKSASPPLEPPSPSQPPLEPPPDEDEDPQQQPETSPEFSNAEDNNSDHLETNSLQIAPQSSEPFSNEVVNQERHCSGTEEERVTLEMDVEKQC